MGGVFLQKKWTFPQRRVHYVQYQYFILHFTYLGVRTHPTHPYGLGTCANARQHSDDSDAARHAAPFID